MERTRHNNSLGKWFVAYYIRFNSPQLKYGPFDSLSQLFDTTGLKAILPGDIIVRMVSDKSIFSVKYQFSPKFEWVYIQLPFIYSNRSGTWEILELNPKKIDYGKNKKQEVNTSNRYNTRSVISKNEATQKTIW